MEKVKLIIAGKYDTNWYTQCSTQLLSTQVIMLHADKLLSLHTYIKLDSVAGLPLPVHQFQLLHSTGEAFHRDLCPSRCRPLQYSIVQEYVLSL